MKHVNFPQNNNNQNQGHVSLFIRGKVPKIYVFIILCVYYRSIQKLEKEIINDNPHDLLKKLKLKFPSFDSQNTVK